MSLIKSAFSRAASGPRGFSTFWMLVWAVAILDDARRREEERRSKCEPQAAKPRKKPPVPRPL